MVDQPNMSCIAAIRIQLIDDTAGKCLVNVGRSKEQIVFRDILPETRAIISCRVPVGAVRIPLAVTGKAAVFQTLGDKIRAIVPVKKFISSIVTGGVVSADSLIA